METENTVQRQIASIPLDTLVHLGAGRCTELEEHRALKPTSLILVEGDPLLATELEERVKGMDDVTVVGQVISGHPGKRLFRRFNQPDLSSLNEPSEKLLNLYPGLRVLAGIGVEAVSPETLLAGLELTEEGRNYLVIDLPGEELSVLKSMKSADKLRLFDEIQLNTGRERFYVQGSMADEILSWFQKQGYDLISEDISRDPERPSWHLRRNKLQIRLQGLEKQLKDLRSERDLLREKYLVQQQINDELKGSETEGKNRTAMLEQQLSEAKSELTKQGKFAFDREKQLEQISNVCAEKTLIAEKKTSELKVIAEEQQQLKTQLENLKTLFEEQNQELKRQKADFSQQKEQLDKFKQISEDRQKAAAEYVEQIKQLKSANEEASKLVATQEQKANELLIDRDREAGLARERKERVDQLESELQDLRLRNQLLKEEMIKAEGQVDLIKDVLLREAGI